MVLVDGQKGGFVADVGDGVVVEVVETADKGRRSAEGGYERGHVVRDEEGVFPDRTLKGFGCVVLEGADAGGVWIDWEGG